MLNFCRRCGFLLSHVSCFNFSPADCIFHGILLNIELTHDDFAAFVMVLSTSFFFTLDFFLIKNCQIVQMNL